MAYTKDHNGQWLRHNDAEVMAWEDPCLDDDQGNDYVVIYRRNANATVDVWTHGTSEALQPMPEPDIGVDVEQMFRNLVYKFFALCENDNSFPPTEAISKFFREHHPNQDERKWVSVVREMCSQNEDIQDWELKTGWCPGGEKYEAIQSKDATQ